MFAWCLIYTLKLQADNYEGTGCYNLKCPGFVQTNKKILLGGALEPTSLYNGQQYEFPLKIWKVTFKS